VDFCVQLGVKAVMGNHEVWLHKYLTTGDFDEYALHKAMGGKATLESYGCMWTGKPKVEEHLGSAIPEPHRQYILEMPLWRRVTVGDTVYYLSHSGIDDSSAQVVITALEEGREDGLPIPLPGTIEYSDEIFRTVEAIQPNVLLWAGISMRAPDVHLLAPPQTQVFGHTPAGRHPVMSDQWVALDTGCGAHWPHILSAIVLTDRSIIQVNRLTGKVGPGVVSDFDLD
jgi:hypothetical protein